MQMLQAAGIACVTDTARPPDASNPRGYFEAECVKQLRGGDTKVVLEIIRGRAVKIIYRLLYHLPAPYDADVLFVRRDVLEVLSSQAAMLARQGRRFTAAQHQRSLSLYLRELQQFEDWLQRRIDFRTCIVSYSELVADPRRTAAELAMFLGIPHAADAMSQVVDASLYRERAQAGLNVGMAS